MRSTRPRPLAIAEKLPVFLEGCQFDSKDVLSDNLRQAEALHGSNLNAHLPISLSISILDERGKQTAQSVQPAAISAKPLTKASTTCITLPTIRKVEDFESNLAALRSRSTALPGTSVRQRKPVTHQEAGGRAPSSYDLEDEDESWMQQYNAQASREGRITEDQTEHAIEALEEAHLTLLKAHLASLPSSSTAPTAPVVPAAFPPPSEVLSEKEGSRVLQPLCPAEAVDAVYAHWLARRKCQHLQGPVLQHLWLQFPWKVSVGEGGVFADVEEQGRRHRLTQDIAWDHLMSIRTDLEQVRTIADQIRKREKLKRQLVLVWKQIWLLKMEAAKQQAKVQQQQHHRNGVSAKSSQKQRTQVKQSAPGSSALSPVGVTSTPALEAHNARDNAGGQAVQKMDQGIAGASKTDRRQEDVVEAPLTSPRGRRHQQRHQQPDEQQQQAPSNAQPAGRVVAKGGKHQHRTQDKTGRGAVESSRGAVEAEQHQRLGGEAKVLASPAKGVRKGRQQSADAMLDLGKGDAVGPQQVKGGASDNLEQEACQGGKSAIQAAPRQDQVQKAQVPHLVAEGGIGSGVQRVGQSRAEGQAGGGATGKHRRTANGRDHRADATLQEQGHQQPDLPQLEVGKPATVRRRKHKGGTADSGDSEHPGAQKHPEGQQVAAVVGGEVARRKMRQASSASQAELGQDRTEEGLQRGLAVSVRNGGPAQHEHGADEGDFTGLPKQSMRKRPRRGERHAADDVLGKQTHAAVELRGGVDLAHHPFHPHDQPDVVPGLPRQVPGATAEAAGGQPEVVSPMQARKRGRLSAMLAVPIEAAPASPPAAPASEAGGQEGIASAHSPHQAGSRRTRAVSRGAPRGAIAQQRAAAGRADPLVDVQRKAAVSVGRAAGPVGPVAASTVSRQGGPTGGAVTDAQHDRRLRNCLSVKIAGLKAGRFGRGRVGLRRMSHLPAGGERRVEGAGRQRHQAAHQLAPKRGIQIHLAVAAANQHAHPASGGKDGAGVSNKQASRSVGGKAARGRGRGLGGDSTGPTDRITKEVAHRGKRARQEVEGSVARAGKRPKLELRNARGRPLGTGKVSAPAASSPAGARLTRQTRQQQALRKASAVAKDTQSECVTESAGSLENMGVAQPSDVSLQLKSEGAKDVVRVPITSANRLHLPASNNILVELLFLTQPRVA